jgi:hypothetical protein
MRTYRSKSNFWIWKELDFLLKELKRNTTPTEDRRVDVLKAILCRRRRSHKTI